MNERESNRASGRMAAPGAEGNRRFLASMRHDLQKILLNSTPSTARDPEIGNIPFSSLSSTI